MKYSIKEKHEVKVKEKSERWGESERKRTPKIGRWWIGWTIKCITRPII